MPAWGWRAEEADVYRQKLTGKAGTNSWGATVVAAAAGPAAAPKPPGEAGPAPLPQMPPAVKAYCQNIENAALDARFLGQKAELLRLEDELAQRTSQLEAKRAEYQEWLKRRDEFIGKAEGSLVELYAKIKPDAAALQLSAIDEEAAAALLMKLNPRNASAILNQMESEKAARLVSVMIGAAKPPEKAAAPVPARQEDAKEKAAAQQQGGKL